jgi:excisionase family DNA binding protein
MCEPNNSLAEALAAIIKPIVTEAIREAMNLNLHGAMHAGAAAKSFLTVKQAADTSGLAAPTIRLMIRKRQLPAQKVGRRVLIKRIDLAINEATREALNWLNEHRYGDYIFMWPWGDRVGRTNRLRCL